VLCLISVSDAAVSSQFAQPSAIHVFDLIPAELASLQDEVRIQTREKAGPLRGTDYDGTLELHKIEPVVERDGKACAPRFPAGSERILDTASVFPDQGAVAFDDLIRKASRDPERSQFGKQFAMYPNHGPKGGR
jgi:hypothetical protein